MKRSFSAKLKRGILVALPIAIIYFVFSKIFFLAALEAEKIPGPKITDGLIGIAIGTLIIVLIAIIADKIIDFVPFDRPFLKFIEKKLPFFGMYKAIMRDTEGRIFQEISYYDGGVLRRGILTSEAYTVNIFGKDVAVWNVLEPRPGSAGGRTCQLEEREFSRTGRSGFETIKEIVLGYGIR